MTAPSITRIDARSIARMVKLRQVITYGGECEAGIAQTAAYAGATPRERFLTARPCGNCHRCHAGGDVYSLMFGVNVQ